MAMNFSEEVEGVLHRAFVAACEAGHATITPEHIALELMVEDETGTYLVRCGTDLVAVESRLRAYLGRMESSGGEDVDAQPGPAFQRVVEAAIQRTEDDGREYLMLRDLFLALIDERDTAASVAILEATRDPRIFEELQIYPSEED
jgi:ATP-dependent Clp protease ATP-binding subunit ClpA